MQSGTVPRSPPTPQTRFIAVAKEISELLAEDATPAEVSRILRELKQIDDSFGISDRASELLLDIFETLSANASHSRLRIENIDISTQNGSTSPAYIRVQYEPDGVLVRADRMKQLCVAPIADEQTHTFHYGLFLLASQIRMVGGVASGKPVSEDPLGAAAFGVCFLIPLEKD